MSRPNPCPDCGDEVCYDEVDVGVGVIRGPIWCYCGWTEEFGTDEHELIEFIDAELSDSLDGYRLSMT